MGKQHKPDRHEKEQNYIHEIRKPHERPGFADAGPETKGGEYHRGPKRWTGRGPAPARHIPWPELFKHHISVVEGHQKMMDMVRKHILEGTPNHRMISAILDRCRTMLMDTKQIAYSFVPPPEARDAVPLGSSSASMYPGYSPADHIYGEAAAEYATHVRAMEKKGVQVKTPGDVEYTINQKETAKRKLMEQAHSQQASDGNTQTSHSRPLVNGTVNPSSSSTGPTTNGHANSNPSTANANLDANGNPLFVIDTNPLQLDLPEFSNPHASKRAKIAHDGALPSAEPETEDISAEVDAKLKAKKEKKKDREKKRKRESEGFEEVAIAVEEDEEGEKPASKKSKKEKKKKGRASKGEEVDTDPAAPEPAEDIEMADAPVPASNAVENPTAIGSSDDASSGEKKRKRKEKTKKKDKETKAGKKSKDDGEAGDEKPKKKSKKSKKGD